MITIVEAGNVQLGGCCPSYSFIRTSEPATSPAWCMPPMMKHGQQVSVFKPQEATATTMDLYCVWSLWSTFPHWICNDTTWMEHLVLSIPEPERWRVPLSAAPGCWLQLSGTWHTDRYWWFLVLDSLLLQSARAPPVTTTPITQTSTVLTDWGEFEEF